MFLLTVWCAFTYKCPPSVCTLCRSRMQLQNLIFRIKIHELTVEWNRKSITTWRNVVLMHWVPKGFRTLHTGQIDWLIDWLINWLIHQPFYLLLSVRCHPPASWWGEIPRRSSQQWPHVEQTYTAPRLGLDLDTWFVVYLLAEYHTNGLSCRARRWSAPAWPSPIWRRPPSLTRSEKQGVNSTPVQFWW